MTACQWQWQCGDHCGSFCVKKHGRRPTRVLRAQATSCHPEHPDKANRQWTLQQDGRLLNPRSKHCLTMSQQQQQQRQLPGGRRTLQQQQRHAVLGECSSALKWSLSGSGSPNRTLARPAASPSPHFVPGLPHVILIEWTQALISYQDYHTLLLTLAGQQRRLPRAGS